MKGDGEELTNSATSLELPLRDSLWTLDLSLSLDDLDAEGSLDDMAGSCGGRVVVGRCKVERQLGICLLGGWRGTFGALGVVAGDWAPLRNDDKQGLNSTVETCRYKKVRIFFPCPFSHPSQRLQLPSDVLCLLSGLSANSY